MDIQDDNISVLSDLKAADPVGNTKNFCGGYCDCFECGLLVKFLLRQYYLIPLLPLVKGPASIS